LSMALIDEIREKIYAEQFEFSKHAVYEPDPDLWIDFRIRRTS
jgi:hypothetical protein